MNCNKFQTTAILGSIVVSISECHSEDRGSIPRREAYVCFSKPFVLLMNILFGSGNELQQISVNSNPR